MPFLFMPPVLNAAYNPLEIINIKPAGTGNPAISPNHRIYRAYPGIEYNIRAAVIGGMYPYKFSLSNAPYGMTINENTGVISWPNPQTSAQSIRLTVTDAENHVATSTWSINVTQNGFIFIDTSRTGTETGRISQPYNSIQDILNLSGRESDIVYFRAGTYAVPIFRADYSMGIGCNLAYYSNPSPHIWLAYPGETVTIDMDKHYFEVGASLQTPYYFDGIRFFNAHEYGFRASSSSNYVAFYRCKFETLRTDRTNNSNQGFYFTSADSIGNYLVFQDCEFQDYVGSGIGSLYYQNKMLVEDCYFHNHINDNFIMGTSAIAPKAGVANSTFRHNRIVIGEGSTIGGSNGVFTEWNGTFSSNNEICFNLLHNTSGGESSRFNGHDVQGLTLFYRNTVIGRITLRAINSGQNNGPWIFDNNVIINNDNGLYFHYSCGTNPQNYVTFTNNLTGNPAQGIINSNGSLTSNYSSYIGTRGWQTVNSTVIDTKTPAIPTGLIIDVY